MISELSFLIELLLEHKLPKDTRSAVAARIKFVESSHVNAVQQPVQPNGARVSPRAQIAVPPEAQALAATLMAEANADTSPSPLHTGTRARQSEPIPQHAVGVSAAAADAMRQRNELIAAAQQGIAKKGPGVGRGHQPK
jgi:hypothetical protein